MVTAENARAIFDVMRRIGEGADLAEVLQAVVGAVRDATGFERVSLGLLDSALELVPAASVAPDEAPEGPAGRRVPLIDLEAELMLAVPWGGLLFVPGAAEASGPADPQSWHPADVLRAPLRTPEGELVGMLAVSAPRDGRRPDHERCRTLEAYADLAGLALSNDRHTGELEDRLRLAAAVEAIHAAASQEQGVPAILDGIAEPVAMALAADELVVRAFDTEGGVGGAALGGHVVHWPAHDAAPPEIVDVVSRHAREAWDNRAVTTRVYSVGPAPMAQEWTPSGSPAEPGTGTIAATEAPLEGVPHQPVAGGAAGWVRRGRAVEGTGGADANLIHDYLARSGPYAVLYAPLGAGADCLGYLVAVRHHDEAWTPHEVEAAAQAARHLGQAVLNARVLERERSVVEQLDALDRYTAGLITTVSHELRTPLTSIRGHLEIIQDDPLAAPDESYAVIGRNLERMQGLINDLLTLHKLSEDAPLDRSSVVDLAQVARDAVAALRPRAEAKGVSLELAAPPGPLLIGGDRDELERVALNLTSNGITYTPAGGRVQVECQRSDRFVRLIVSDTGIGISKADQEELFTDFYRTNNPEALTMPGTGLGLSIVRRIVQRHTGSIRLESDTGQGSAFTVRLPVSHV